MAQRLHYPHTRKEEVEMFTDDIPRDWVEKEVGCYTHGSSMAPHVGKLLKIGSESLLILEDKKPSVYNAAFLQRVVLRTKVEKE
jgi:hypothetical protein